MQANPVVQLDSRGQALYSRSCCPTHHYSQCQQVSLSKPQISHLIIWQALLRRGGGSKLIFPGRFAFRSALNSNFTLLDLHFLGQLPVLLLALPAGAAPNGRDVLPRAEETEETQHLEQKEALWNDCLSFPPPEKQQRRRTFSNSEAWSVLLFLFQTITAFKRCGDRGRDNSHQQHR